MNKWKNEINPDIAEELKNMKRAVLIGGPHTSFEDGYRAIKFKKDKEIKKILKDRVKIVMKKSMFLPIIGKIFKKMGFIPVDRKNPREFWDNSFENFSNMDEFIWSFAPEGTKKSVEKWPNGFLRAAEHFGIPIIVACIDYEERRASIEKIIQPDQFLTEDKIDSEKIPELERILIEIFKDKIPKYPEKFNPNIKIKFRKQK